MNKKLKGILIILFITMTYSAIAYALDIRICLFYNLFKIPCPSCGLTRSLLALLSLDFAKSLQYNIMTIPFIMLIIFIIGGHFIDYLLKQQKFDCFLNKYKIVLIIIVTTLMIISWILNLNNPLLY